MKYIAAFGIAIVVFLGATYNSGCNVVRYGFKDISIPDSIKTVKVNLFNNKARYVNVQLSPRLTDKLRQKIVGQTRLTQTNNDIVDWEINGDITQYNVTTSAISGQRETGNRLTVAVHVTLVSHKEDKTSEYDVTRNFEFAATQSLPQAEAILLDEMLRSLTDDIFNRVFSSW